MKAVKAWFGRKAADGLERLAVRLEKEGENKEGHEFLSGNYAPVDGDSFAGPSELKVLGDVPTDLRGHFLRIGPNAALPPRTAYHIFDGDGMVHIVRFDGAEGAAGCAYSRHQIETVKLAQEREAGRPIRPTFGGMKGLPGLARMVSFEVRVMSGSAERGSVANTAMVHHAGRTLALNEGDAPYEIAVKDGRASTVGRLQPDRLTPFTAHPKLDPETHFLHSFGYSLKEQPYVRYYVLDDAGGLVHELEIELPRPIMMHDFAMTENYVLFLDMNVVFEGKEMRNNRLPFYFDKDKEARIGVMRKMETDASKITWIPVDPHVVFHVMNAWEEGPNAVRLLACRINNFDMNLDHLVRDDMPDDERGFLCSYELDLAAKTARCQTILNPPGLAVDFPVVEAALVGRESRFGFLVGLDEKEAVVAKRVYKVDLAEPSAEPQYIDFGEGRHGGECVFVPREEDRRGPDDGYLITFIWDSNAQKSECVVWDAFTMAEEPLCRVLLPTRVPYGFHGLFVTEEEAREG